MSGSAPQERSIASLEKLSSAGRTADVYRWDDSTVLKLARGPEFNAAFEREALALRAASAVPGLTPNLRETVTIDGRTGLLMERVAGVDLLKEIEKKPWRIWSIGRELAEVHVRLNSLRAPDGLRIAREEISRMLQSPAVPEPQRAFAVSLLESLPDGDRLCHLDFHPGNLMRGHGELKVIDLASACAGDPDWDFAVTRSLLDLGELPAGTPRWLRMVAGLGRRTLLASYNRRYRQLRAVDEANLQRWTAVFLAQRLADEIPEERDRILQRLRKGTAGER